MKTSIIIKSLLVSLILILIVSPDKVIASESVDSIMINNADILHSAEFSNMYIAANDSMLNEGTGKPAESNNSFQINWHKYLGWTTIGMMGITISTGFIIPDRGHCALAGISTGFAIATCVDGIYEYGGLISITDGDWRYNTHALLGTLATAGFITSLALADGESHVATGIASGTAFTIALVVIYF